jgi:hypothetical protein
METEENKLLESHEPLVSSLEESTPRGGGDLQRHYGGGLLKLRIWW